jgi:hypothetical protein
LPPEQLVDKEAMLLESMQTAPQDLDRLIARFGVDVMDEIPDDIAVLMVNRG